MKWPNKGYVVLVPDAFPFASRRVLLKDVEPAHLRKGLTDDDPESIEHVNAYNAWASDHEPCLNRCIVPEQPGLQSSLPRTKKRWTY